VGYTEPGSAMAIYSPLLAPHIQARRLQSGRACITELGLEQRCPRCGEFWPWDTEFFGVASDASGSPAGVEGASMNTTNS